MSLDRRTFVNRAAVFAAATQFPTLVRAQSDAARTVTTKQLGCKSDGVTDDSPALAAAAQDVRLGKINQITVSPGTLVLAGTNVDFNAAPNGLAIIGTPGASTIQMNSGAGARPFRIRGINGVHVSGVAFHVTHYDVPNDCLDVMNCSRVVIESCKFSNSTFYGLGMFEDAKANVAAEMDDILVQNNEFHDIGCIGMECFPKVKSRNWKITQNRFFNCGRNPLRLSSSGYVPYGVALKAGAGVDGMEISGNVVRNSVNGIFIATYERVSAHDNTIINPDVFGFDVSVSPHPKYPNPSLAACELRNNTVMFEPGFTPPRRYPAIEVNGRAQNNGPISIVGNTLNRTQGIEIRANAALRNIVISQNRFIDIYPGAPDVVADGARGAAPQSIEVSGNHMTDSGARRPARIRITGAGNAIVRDNDN